MSFDLSISSNEPKLKIADIRKKAKKPENIWFRIYYFLSAYIVWLSVRFRWSPNNITLIALAVNFIGLVLFLVMPVKWSTIFLCYGIFNLAHVFDCADGHLAFVTNQRSAKGAWLDSSIDVFKLAFVTICFIKLIYNTSPQYNYERLALAVVALGSIGNIVNYAVSIGATNYRSRIDAYEQLQINEVVSSSGMRGQLHASVLSNLREYGNFLLLLLAFAIDRALGLVLLSLWGAVQWVLAAARIRRIANMLA